MVRAPSRKLKQAGAWLCRAAAIAVLVSSGPALACSCVPAATAADRAEWAKAALAEADLAVVVRVDPEAPSAHAYCGDDSRALAGTPDQSVWLFRRATILKTIKGSETGPIMLAERQLEIRGGQCLVMVDSCETSIADASRLLLKRVADQKYEAARICAQRNFWDHHREQEARRSKRR